VSALPLSPAQQRLWFLQALDPDDPSYHITVACEFHGLLRVVALRTAVAAVMRRHAVLRSAFTAQRGRLAQRAIPPGAPSLRLADLRGHGERAALGVLARAARRPLDLAGGRPAEWFLVRREPGVHVLVLLVHHIAFDGGSLAIVAADLAAAYDAACRGRPAGAGGERARALPGSRAPEPVDTRDLAHWRGRLEDAPPPLKLWSRPEARDPGGERRAVTAGFTLGPARARLLGQRAREAGATPFMVVLAALVAALARYTGRTDLVVGTPVSTRTGERGADVVGPLLNLLPLRVAVPRGGSFADLVGNVRECALDAIDHAGVPFERLVSELAPERRLGTSPLFQVLFAHLRAPEPPALTGVASRLVTLAPPAARYHLTVTCTERREVTELALDADAAECDEQRLAGFARHLDALLGAALDDPGSRVERLATATPARTGAAATRRGPSRQDTVHGLVRRAALRRPDALAVQALDGALSYRGLVRAATRLAAALRAAGAGPERVVAVNAGRTTDLLVALVAVLESGAAYLPLDPAYPPARSLQMLDDARPVALLTTPELQGALPTGVPTVLTTAAVAGGGDRGGSGAAQPRNLAYVLYTSGSTGRPKGVAIEHRGAATFLRWAVEEFGGALSRTLASTSVAFDLSVFELLAPLAAGATVLLAGSPLEAGRAPSSASATLVNTVPSVAEALLDSGTLPRSLVALNLAGEPLRAGLVRRAHERSPGVRIRNLYGPSEATTYATGAVVDPAAPGQPGIGRAVAGAEVWLSGGVGLAVPPGAEGEIHIGGPAVARGYLGQPGATAARFVPDPRPGAAGERVYRTGDLAVAASDGSLAFLGRTDNQVKVRGVRVELEEIEALVERHAEVAEAAVVADGDTAGTRRLVAFVRPSGLAEVPVRAIRDGLRERLPSVMVPSAWTVLGEWPRTATGKLDRRALEALAAGARPPASRSAPPSTRTERAVAGLWTHVLGTAVAGVDDAFFDAGGSSLQLLELQERLRSALGADMTLADLFRHATVAAQARFVDSGGDAGGRPPTGEPARRGRDGALRRQRRLRGGARDGTGA
jgi:nonribosomal peptide synthetase protein BlmIX